MQTVCDDWLYVLHTPDGFQTSKFPVMHSLHTNGTLTQLACSQEPLSAGSYNDPETDSQVDDEHAAICWVEDEQRHVADVLA